MTQHHGGQDQNSQTHDTHLDTGGCPTDEGVTEADLIEILRLQERKLGPTDPGVLDTKKRLDQMVKARLEAMTLEQRMQSAMGRLSHKEKIHKEALAKAARAQEVVESAQMQLLIEHDKTQILKDEYDKANDEYKKLLEEMHAKKCTADATGQAKPGLASFGIALPDDAPAVIKDQAKAVQAAIAQLAAEIEKLSVKAASAKEQVQQADTVMENNTPRTRGGKSKSVISETLSVASDGPAHKRSNAPPSSSSVLIESVETCP